MNLSARLSSLITAGRKLLEFCASTPSTGVKSVVILMSWSMWLLNDWYGGADRVIGAGEQRSQLSARLGEGPHRFDGLVQRVEKIGRRCLQPPGRVDQRGYRRGAGIGADDRIELIEKVIQLRRAVQQGDAAVVGGGRERGQDSHRFVFSAAPGRGEQVAQLADGGLEQHGRQPGVLGDVRARADGARGLQNRLSTN